MTTDDKPQDTGASASADQALVASDQAPTGFDPARMVSVPLDPPEAMWDGLPRAIMLWLDFARPTPEALFNHLRCSGYEVPDWMREEGELKAINHVPSKGTRCVLVYRAMVENWLAAIAMEARQGRDGVTRLDGEAATARASEGGIAHD